MCGNFRYSCDLADKKEKPLPLVGSQNGPEFGSRSRRFGWKRADSDGRMRSCKRMSQEAAGRALYTFLGAIFSRGRSRSCGFLDRSDASEGFIMSSQESSSQVTLGDAPSLWYPDRRGGGFRLSLRTDPPSVVELPAMRSTLVSIHIGPPAHVSCRRGRLSHHGTAVHGDIDIIPSGTPSVWEMKNRDTVLNMAIAPRLLNMAAESFDLDPAQVEIRNRFQARDSQLENIGWVLKAEMESGYPSGRLYVESLAVAIAARLVGCHSSRSQESARLNGQLSD